MDIFETLENNYILYENIKILVIIDINNELWFNANNTAKALGYSDLRDAIRTHVEKKDTKQLKYINYKHKTGHPLTLYLNEAGLYSLMLRSRMPKAKKFTNWVTHDVLPSIRKFGSYKLKKKYESKLAFITKKIRYLEKENEKMKNDLRKEKFPTGGIVYVVDYSTDKKNIYRIGMTNNMNLRKKIYDTHSLHKHNVIYMKKHDCPIKLETCLRAMLYDYRYKNKKDFYLCKIETIKKAFSTCIKSMYCVNKNQKGGSNKLPIKNELADSKKNEKFYKKEIKKLDKKIKNTA